MYEVSVRSAPSSDRRAPAPVVQTFAFLAGRLAEEGYAPGLPEHVRPESAAIDAVAAVSTACPGCGRVGLEAMAYHNGPRYRCLAVCLACGTAEEM